MKSAACTRCSPWWAGGSSTPKAITRRTSEPVSRSSADRGCARWCIMSALRRKIMEEEARRLRPGTAAKGRGVAVHFNGGGRHYESETDIDGAIGAWHRHCGGRVRAIGAGPRQGEGDGDSGDAVVP